MLKYRNKILILILIVFFGLNINALSNVTKEPDMLWQKIVGGKSYERFNDIKETDDFGYIVVGHTNSNDFYSLYGDLDALLAKYNTEGNVEWIKTYGGEGADVFNSVNVCRDGGFIVAGFTQSKYGNAGSNKVKGEEALIIKFDYRGNIDWKTTFGGSLSDRFIGAIEVSDGYLVVGYSNSIDGDLQGLNKGEYDGVVVKLDRKGNIEWKRVFGGSGWDKFFSAIEVTDGYIVVGYSDSKDKDLNKLNIEGEDGVIVKYDRNGHLVWSKSFGGGGEDEIKSICKIEDGFVIVGSTSSYDRDLKSIKYSGQVDAFISRLDYDGKVKWTRTFGGSEEDSFTSVFFKSDYGIIAVGNSKSQDYDMQNLNSGKKDALAVKYDLEGNLVWKKAYGKSGEDVFSSAVYSDFLGFIGVGYTTSKEFDVKGNEDCLMVKFEEPRIEVSAIYFPEQKKEVKKGETLKLSVNFVPVNATVKKLKWTSSDNNVATVDENGVVKAKRVGEAIITAKSVDGGYEATCKIKVRHNFDKNKLPFMIWANKSIIHKIKTNF